METITIEDFIAKVYQLLPVGVNLNGELCQRAYDERNSPEEAAHAHINGVPIEVTGPDPVPEPVCVVILRRGEPPLLPKNYAQAKLWSRGRKRTQIGRGVVLFREKNGYCLLAERRGRVKVIDVWLPSDEG
jgi:hypothetical protein